MDDIDTIRDVLAGPPPSPQATFRARNRLTAAIEAPRQRPGRRRAIGWSLGGGAALAGLATVALVVPMLTRADPPERPAPGAVAPAEMSAHDILLAAAGRAGQAPAHAGRYWHVRTVGVHGPQQVGVAPNRYLVVGRTVSETWIARDTDDKSWTGYRALGHRPRSEADRRAWRAAGSPTYWDIDADSTSGTLRLSTRPGKPTLGTFDNPVRYLDDLGGFDVDGLRRLPHDPAKLRAFLVARIASYHGYAPGTPESNIILFSRVSQLLLDAPAPPRVRAAAFAVVAEIPNVRSLGEVVDGEGRTGLGIQLDRTSTDITEHHKIIIDRATYLILAHEYVAERAGQPGARPVKEGNVVILKAEWTDKAPRPPAIP